MHFSYWISKRLKLSGTSSGSSATGSAIAVAGVALSLMVMLLSVAVTVGFKHQIERKVMGFEAPITVLPTYDYNLGETGAEMHITPALEQAIKASATDARPVATIRRHAVLKTDSAFLAVECLAYGEGHDWSFEQSNMVSGNARPEGDSIVISTAIARMLGITDGLRPYIYFFVDGKPKARRVSVQGEYNANFSEYDKSIIYAPFDFLKRLSADTTAVSAVALEGCGGTPAQIVEATNSLRGELVRAYQQGLVGGIHAVTNAVERGTIFFSWLDLLDTNVTVIFILMSFVAAFTLISSLFIIILDRVSTIGILRSLGMSRTAVSRVFIYMAMRIVGIGMAIGNVFALGIIWLQQSTHFLPLNPEMYYLDSVPMEISWQAAVLINMAVAAGAWLILIFPARLAARIDPATTMRYE